MSRTHMLAVVLLSLAASGIVAAQSITMVRVVRVAAVLEEPAGDARAVGTVAAGEVLDVLDERNGWYLVRPAAGGAPREWRAGWVNAVTVESMRSSPQATTAQTLATRLNEGLDVSANRKGFLIGAGGGAALHRTPTFSVFDRSGRVTGGGGGTGNMSFVTNFIVGYAPTDRALLYYSNRAVFTSNESYDALGVTGLGMTYMFRRTIPTAYLTGSFGGGFGANLYRGSAMEAGLGWSGGAGWEFRRHLSLEGDVLFVRFGGGETHSVCRGCFHYTFY